MRGFVLCVAREHLVCGAVVFETMPILGWRVHFTRRQLMTPRTPRPALQSLPTNVIAGWLDGEGIEDGVPYLVSPDAHYDIDLNTYFWCTLRRRTLWRRSPMTWAAS